MAENNFVWLLENEKKVLQKKLEVINRVIAIYKSLGAELAKNESSVNKLMQQMSSSDGTQQQGEVRTANLFKNQKDKVIFILKREQRFLHTREIATFAAEIIENIPGNHSRGTLVSSLSILKKKYPESNIVSIQVGGSHINTYWGFQEWLDEKGEIIAKYNYNKISLAKEFGGN